MTQTSARLQTISTEIMIAFVFSIISIALFGAFLIFFLVPVIGGLAAIVGCAQATNAVASPFGPAAGPAASGLAAAAFLASVLPLLIAGAPAVMSLFVTLRLNKMRIAAAENDIAQLRELDSVGWAIIALIFALIVPGVLMLVAHSEISNLPALATVSAPVASFSSNDMDKLMRLKQLVDNGTITQQDFEAQKHRILGGASAQAESTEPEELRKLKSLLDCGAISAEEYEAHKRRFLEAL